MSLSVHENLTGLLIFPESLGVYVLLMADRSYRILHLADRLDGLCGQQVTVVGKRVAYNILAVDQIRPG
ncbi:MAG: hypothetical protein ACKOXK_11065 [Chakrabartia sp.]